MQIFFKKYFFISILVIASLNATAAPLSWQTLAPGLEYTKINSFYGLPGHGIQAFRFNLRDYQLQLAFAKDQHNIAVASVPSLVIANNAVIGVNGGFFT